MTRCKDCVFYFSRTCSSPKWTKGYHEHWPPEDGVLVEDDEGWAFKVGPLFGCIHGEPKGGS
jgi:hypothetical protein